MNNVIIGDLHGCGYELEEVIRHFPGHNYIAVGDLFDRSSNGVKVWELIHEYNINSCLGNHEHKVYKYLTGERDHLPSHYFYFLNKFVERYSLDDLVSFIESLPLIIKLDDKSLVTHGGVVLYDPWKEDVSANVYGSYDPNKKMPRYSDGADDWWNSYNKDVRVYFGHITSRDIRIKNNTFGLDTSACHGNMLTSICHETGEIFQVKSKDYFSKVKTFDNTPKRCIIEYNMKARTKWLDTQSKMF